MDKIEAFKILFQHNKSRHLNYFVDIEDLETRLSSIKLSNYRDKYPVLKLFPEHCTNAFVLLSFNADFSSLKLSSHSEGYYCETRRRLRVNEKETELTPEQFADLMLYHQSDIFKNSIISEQNVANKLSAVRQQILDEAQRERLALYKLPFDLLTTKKEETKQ